MDKMNLRIDPDDLTIGDLEDFEDFIGTPFNEAFKPRPVVDENGERVFDAKGRPEMSVQVTAKVLRCLVWIVRRKVDPAFTLEDARNVRVSQLELVDGEDDARGNGRSG